MFPVAAVICVVVAVFVFVVILLLVIRNCLVVREFDYSTYLFKLTKPRNRGVGKKRPSKLIICFSS